MAKIKISELPLADTLSGLYTVGVNGDGNSVKASLGFVETSANAAADAADAANKAAESANLASELATVATDGANTAADAANKAAAAASVFGDRAEVYAPITEDEYKELVANGEIEEDKFYTTYEDEE